MAPAAQRPYAFVTKCLEQLGLQTYGKEKLDPRTTIRRPTFNYAPVTDLYYLELSTLFGFLVRDRLDGTDPDLFEDELDYLLDTYGPLIWPKPGEGSRDHLRQPKRGTLYTKHIIYPRDCDKLKKSLRGIILGKQIRPDVNVMNLIKENSKMHTYKQNQSISSRSSQKRKSPESSTSAALVIDAGGNGNAANFVSEDPDTGTRKRRRTEKMRKHSPEKTIKVELRLYRLTKQTDFPSPGPVLSYGSIFLADDCATSEKCFSQICEQIETDCSFMVFQLPEDMSHQNRIRIDRGSRDSERMFHRMLNIFQEATTFPGNPQHPSVEVEVGLEMLSDD